MELSDSQFEQYQSDGYLVVEDALSSEMIERTINRLREYSHGDREPQTFESQIEPRVKRGELDVEEEGDAVRKFEGLGMVEEDDVFGEIANHETITAVAEQLLGEHLKLLRSAAMFKPPSVGSEKGLHQDAAYYPIQPRDHLTVWIALDDATPENGCMTVIPGAHKDGMLNHEADEYETDIVINDTDYSEDDLVELPMEAGDALFTHCLVPHYTAPNTTEDWRRALIMSYMDSRSRFTKPADDLEPWVDSVHIQGEEFPGCV
ncbi:phytanoyl-CoA dioxygenase family protein [Halonotius terrestris]|uniref:Phytanoyl-CoA dioxygenase family protein n=1 Tax=Halonotius terrestris TaxID=2487750 RepID=A0A8J8PBB8_9EURY|nr:phytanoyl-CoA dioxygenase family protein [Halonotius terrestris]TQQ83269.1 phytanoyl-CoA dioxygenase family protein [Halonotius terrestris]